jgi:hypothetical protein
MVGFGHFEYGFPGVSIYFQIPAALHIENQCHYNFQNLCRCNFWRDRESVIFGSSFKKER